MPLATKSSQTDHADLPAHYAFWPKRLPRRISPPDTALGPGPGGAFDLALARHPLGQYTDDGDRSAGEPAV